MIGADNSPHRCEQASEQFRSRPKEGDWEYAWNSKWVYQPCLDSRRSLPLVLVCGHVLVNVQRLVGGLGGYHVLTPESLKVRAASAQPWPISIHVSIYAKLSRSG